MADLVNVHAARTQLSRLVARAERGERITIARGGKPVAELGPVRRRRRASLPADDPLLNLDEFAIEGAGGDLTNEDIDRLLYARAGALDGLKQGPRRQRAVVRSGLASRSRGR